MQSTEGLSRAYAVTVMAACKERNLSSARTQFEKIQERADRGEPVAYCRKFDIELQ